MRILVVEDDLVLGEAIHFALSLDNYAVDRLRCGEAADRALRQQVFDLAILDVGLPGLDGFEVLRRLRARQSRLPVLMLTGRCSEEDKVRGLDLGADDYLVKPIGIRELQARVRALLRRGRYDSLTRLWHGDLCFDTASRTALLNDRPLDLSPREVSLFEVLFTHYGQVVTKQQLLEALYTFDESVGPNAIEVYVHRLRRKLEASHIVVRTVHGRGYQMLGRDEA